MALDLKNSLNKSVERASPREFRLLLLPMEEELYYDYRCSVLTGDSIADGVIFITTHFLVFVGNKRTMPFPENGAGPGRNVNGIRITIPLCKICSFHRAKNTV